MSEKMGWNELAHFFARCRGAFKSHHAPTSPNKTGPTHAVPSTVKSLSTSFCVFSSEYLLALGLMKRLFKALYIKCVW